MASAIKPRVWSKRAPKYPALAVYIGRPTKWGNPYRIGPDGTRKEVIAKYRTWLLARPKLCVEARTALRGQHLLCWCAPYPCHGDVLLEIANG
jgi:hypothetical protein